MLRFLLDIFKSYGFDALQFSVICYFGWKIMTNHLFHLKKQLDCICEKLDKQEIKLNQVTERIAKIEGKIE